MEAFSLLKYWRSSNNTSTTTTSSNTNSNSVVTTLEVVSRTNPSPNSLLRHQIQTQTRDDDYIDIDFASIEEGEENEEEEEATVTVELEDTNSKHNFLPNYLLKSATKFKVLNFKSKKPKESNNQLGSKSEGFGNKRLRKEVINGYMSKIMPLYVKVRGSSDEKIRCGPGLGKCRSAATVAAVPSPPRRRDDSLLQQEDGIQGAIAHCKRSFNVTRAEIKDSTLARSKSNSYSERLVVIEKL